MLCGTHCVIRFQSNCAPFTWDRRIHGTWMFSVIEHLLARATLGPISAPGREFNRWEPSSDTSAPRDTLHGVFLCCTSEPLTSQHELEPQEEQELKAWISFLGCRSVKVMWVGPAESSLGRHEDCVLILQELCGREAGAGVWGHNGKYYSLSKVPSPSFHKGC